MTPEQEKEFNRLIKEMEAVKEFMKLTTDNFDMCNRNFAGMNKQIQKNENMIRLIKAQNGIVK